MIKKSHYISGEEDNDQRVCEKDEDKGPQTWRDLIIIEQTSP